MLMKILVGIVLINFCLFSNWILPSINLHSFSILNEYFPNLGHNETLRVVRSGQNEPGVVYFSQYLRWLWGDIGPGEGLPVLSPMGENVDVLFGFLRPNIIQEIALAADFHKDNVRLRLLGILKDLRITAELDKWFDGKGLVLKVHYELNLNREGDFPVGLYGVKGIAIPIEFRARDLPEDGYLVFNLRGVEKGKVLHRDLSPYEIKVSLMKADYPYYASVNLIEDGIISKITTTPQGIVIPLTYFTRELPYEADIHGEGTLPDTDKIYKVILWIIPNDRGLAKPVGEFMIDMIWYQPERIITLTTTP